MPTHGDTPPPPEDETCSGRECDSKFHSGINLRDPILTISVLGREWHSGRNTIFGSAPESAFLLQGFAVVCCRGPSSLLLERRLRARSSVGAGPLSSYNRDMHNWSPVLAERSPPRGSALTLEEWIKLPEEATGEWMDGHLAEEEVTEPVHDLAVSWLIALFRAWLAGRGFVFASDVKFVVNPTRGRKPDVSVYFPERAAPPRRGALRVPPDVMVEVVSPSPADERRDRVEKMREYAAFGVRYYWIVDPALGSLEIFELDGGRFAQAMAATEGVMTDPPGCPGMRLDLDGLWSELARLDDDEE